MALVTGKYVTSDGKPLPAGAVPLVEVVPSQPSIALDGRTISVEPQEDTPHATTGAYSFDLIPTVDVPGDFHYFIRGSYLAPNGYDEDRGYTRKDIFEARIVVPTEGGNVGELTVIKTDTGLVWVGSTPPPMSMKWHYVSPTYNPDSGLPLPVYTAPDGTTAVHGDLVEWEA